jgi:hypothetical protein
MEIMKLQCSAFGSCRASERCSRGDRVPRKQRPPSAGETNTPAKKADDSKTEHISEERLLGYIGYQLDLNDNEEEHLRACQLCNDQFRMLLTSNAKPKAS